MYNPKDIQFVGKHDYNRESAENYANFFSASSFSVNIFRWELKANGEGMKPSKNVVRVKGLCINKEKVFEVAENIINRLDTGTWDGRKTVSVK